MNKEFVGAVGTRAFLIESVRAAFKNNRFNVCTVWNLPEYNKDTFATWVDKLHCVDCDEATLRRARFYVVNYFLCPNSDDALEVEAMFREVFEPPQRESKKTEKPILSIGNYRIVKVTETREVVE